jgi:hypothetical protein
MHSITRDATRPTQDTMFAALIVVLFCVGSFLAWVL